MTVPISAQAGGRPLPLKARLLRLLFSPLGLTLLALAAFILGATFVYMELEGWSFLTALIFALQTVTTIGYGNVFPAHRWGQIFTAALMVVALASVVVLLSTFANRLISLVYRGLSPMERNERAVRALQDHIVVAAAGELASLLAQNLQAKDLPFVAVTEDADVHARWVEEGMPTVLGNPDDEEVLRRAGIERARGLIVALASDADNVFVVLSAHDLNPRLRIAGRAHTASSIPKLRRSGANEVVLPEQITAINLVDLFKEPSRISAAVRQATDELREALGESLTAPPSLQGRSRQVLFRALRLALQELSPDMDATFYALGAQFGREAVGPNLSGEQLCQVLEALSPLWSAAGLGAIQVVACSEQSAQLAESECATCQGLPAVGKPVCHLERGVITGALEARLGRAVNTRETKCWGLGDRVCQFEITVDVEAH